MLKMLKYWLKEFDLDGFRFDAASFIPLAFWEKARTELTQIKADILLLGEEESPEALAKAFNLDYDWKLEEALNNVLTNGLPAQTTLQTVMNDEDAIFPRGSCHLRFTDNHDKKRAISRFGEKGALAASLFIFTVNGVPLIYNGMEVGDTTESKDPALFEKMPIFWKSDEIRPEFFRFYQQIIQLRKNHPALHKGEMIWLKNSDESRIVSYLKKTEQEEFLIMINMSNQPFNGVVEIPSENKYENLTPLLQLAPVQTTDAFPTISLKAWEYRLYKML